MHSSRMRTARALTVSPSMLCAGEGGVWSRECLLQGVSSPRGVYLVWGCVPDLGVPASGGGGVVSQLALRQTTPREQNHTCL